MSLRFGSAAISLSEARQFADSAGGIAIRPDAKRIGALELEQIGDFLKAAAISALVMIFLLMPYKCSSTTS